MRDANLKIIYNQPNRTDFKEYPIWCEYYVTEEIEELVSLG